MKQPLTEKPPDILVVDDTQENLHLLAGMIRQRGYKARPVPNGKLALQAAQRKRPDLILLDIHMPEMDGYEVCERLKADDTLKDVPVIFISALHETTEKVKAFKMGGVDYITKPFHFEEVEARIHLQLELHRQKRQLQESYQELRKAEDQRDKLAHMVIHDMRSPLLALNGFLDLLESPDAGRTAEEEKEYVSYCRGAATNLIDMVNSLLDVSKMESGQLKLQLAECHLENVVQNLITRFEALKEQGQIQFANDCESKTVIADIGLITRVFQNLIGTSLKFASSKGTVKVAISYTETEARVSISDNGHGIPEQFHKIIFEKFGQIENKTNRIGTGLGLAFCKLAVEKHGGRIGLESESGRGSTFWFVLPLKPAIRN